MPELRENGPYIYPTWLPKRLAGLDRCEWGIWFQVHHDGRTWEKLDSGFNLTRYNIEHTELLRLCSEEYEQRGFTVTVERQNEFRLNRDWVTISGGPDLVASRDDETIIVDVKAAKPNPSHEIQVMLYMAWLPLADGRYQGIRLQGQVYYGEDNGIDIPATEIDHRFKEITAGFITRLTSKTPARNIPSPGECRFCPISSQYCPDRREE